MVGNLIGEPGLLQPARVLIARSKSSKRASATSTRHATQSDQASLAALRCSTQTVFTLVL